MNIHGLYPLRRSLAVSPLAPTRNSAQDAPFTARSQYRANPEPMSATIAVTGNRETIMHRVRTKLSSLFFIPIFFLKVLSPPPLENRPVRDFGMGPSQFAKAVTLSHTTPFCSPDPE